MSFQTLGRSSLLAAVTALLLPAAPAHAQTACITPNCTLGGTPTQCLNRALPRTPTVQLGNGGTFTFQPSNPKIEPGDCIIWRSVSSTHSSAGDSCTATSACNTPPDVGCEWDSANISSLAMFPMSTCYYDPALFPAAAADPYHCRQHAALGMRGTLNVTTAIQLQVDKDFGTSSVKLSWTGGGVTGDVSYKVERQSGGDPRFPTASTTTMNPDGGVLGTTFTDAGDLLVNNPRYYLVRNKQTNEP